MNPTRLTLIAVSFACSFTAAVVARAARADVGPGAPEMTKAHLSPNGVSESCSVPRTPDLAASLGSGKVEWANFFQKQVDTSKDLCEVNFYDASESTAEHRATALCPKLSSTNPGTILCSIPAEMTRATFMAKEWGKAVGREGKSLAKFKQSTSCSNTSSILAYPRFGQMLDSPIEMPFTLYRSMDRKEHLKFSIKSYARAKAISATALITQTWASLVSAETGPAAKPDRRALPLSRERFGRLRRRRRQHQGRLLLQRGERFLLRRPREPPESISGHRRVRAAQERRPGRKWGWKTIDAKNVELVQKMIQLREMGDLVTLDSILSQQDRFGNIRFRWFYHRLDADGANHWKKAEFSNEEKQIVDPVQAKELAAQGYLLVKRMHLNDNDCGVSKENRFWLANNKAGMAPRVTHLHPSTYLAVINLQKMSMAGTLESYLKTELLFQPGDFANFKLYLKKTALTYQSRCLAGQLFLDADLGALLGLHKGVDSKDFCAQNRIAFGAQ